MQVLSQMAYGLCRCLYAETVASSGKFSGEKSQSSQALSAIKADGMFISFTDERFSQVFCNPFL